MKNSFFKIWLCLCIFVIFLSLNFAQAETFMDFTSSPNPVGSGAVALGMGGAYISMAHDATAASWNPACLVRLYQMEASVVGDWTHRIEDNSFGTNPNADGEQNIFKERLNYLSFAYPTDQILNRRMVFSLNYQRLYNFSREWRFLFDNEAISPTAKKSSELNYKQDGDISALGLAYAAIITPERWKAHSQIAFGLTLNCWDDDLLNNKWDEHQQELGKITVKGIVFPGKPPITRVDNIDNSRHNAYSFSGVNFNIGLLLKLVSIFHSLDEINIGLVFKSPFTADITREFTITEITNGQIRKNATTHYDEELDMPMSYGIGVSYKYSEAFVAGIDVYRTHWEDYIIKGLDGTEVSLVTGNPPDNSDVDATTQIRLGGEYQFKYGAKNIFPLRMGAFYDPAPAQDDYYGLAIGGGWIRLKKSYDNANSLFSNSLFSFDIAYQYRWGNDVSKSLISKSYDDYQLSQDMKEHMIYTSLTFYF
ncbi:MAG: hypothetical protein GY795_00825 [Desulfobacterales bacterium]|nr:hypothetical protein [Desulfobacterales bacterium]